MEDGLETDSENVPPPPPPPSKGSSKLGFFLLKWLQFAAWWSLVSGLLGFGAYGWAGAGFSYGKGIVVGGFWGLIYALFKLRSFDRSRSCRHLVGAPSWIVIALMVSFWILVGTFLVIRPGEEGSVASDQKVRIVSINGEVMDGYRPIERQSEVAHVTVIKGNDWWIFDGGWDSNNIEPAIAFGKFETQRRMGTSFQVCLGPRYEPSASFLIYEIVRMYDADGVFQYQK